MMMFFLRHYIFQDLAQSDGASREIRQQANIRVLKSVMPRKNGFIALITAIVLSVILLTVAVALNQIGFLTRSEVLDSEYKNRSFALAEACVDTALLKLAGNPSYSGGEPSIAVGSDACAIGVVSQNTPSAGQTTINTSAVFPATSVTSQNAVTRLQIIVNSSDLSLISWDEVP